MLNERQLTVALDSPWAVGVGLRTPHLSQALSASNTIPWFELLADNWFAEGGLDKRYLHEICSRYPVAFHGVNLSLGSLDPLDLEYLKKVKGLLKENNAMWYSEHCSFSAFQGRHSADLLPMPYTEEAVMHISQRIRQTQDYLEQAILLENISCYVTCEDSELSEGEFLNAVLAESGCYLLLDINNVYVNSVNQQYDAQGLIDRLPLDRIKQIHLGGYTKKEAANKPYLLDTHGAKITDPVWDLYYKFMAKGKAVPTIVEWDNDIPEWETMLVEQGRAESIVVSANTNTSNSANKSNSVCV